MSDFLKREDNVGDHISIKKYCNKLPVLFLSFKETGAFIPGPEYYREALKRFGRVINFCYRPSNNNNFRSFILIQMDSINTVVLIREFYNDLEEGFVTESVELCDKTCDEVIGKVCLKA